MNKITLIYNDDTYLPFCLPWIKSEVSEYINIEKYDADKSYSTHDTICYVSYLSAHNLPDWTKIMINRGHRIIIDHLWDSDVDTKSGVTDMTMTLRNPNWLWYYSCIDWRSIGYEQYHPQLQWQHAFFMPMHRQEWHRDRIITSLSCVLGDALYSYVHQGKTLPGDITTGTLQNWRSYFNPEWYNTSCFSVVAESYMRTSAWVANVDNYKTEVSEKLFKPMVGYHPFIVFGSADTLSYLHREGFESFENLFDERYDNVLDDTDRHNAVTTVVMDAVAEYKKNTNKNQRSDITKEKLKHNHARFFDISLVRRRLQDEIIADILEFAEQ